MVFRQTIFCHCDQVIACSAIAYSVHWSAGLAKNQQAETLIAEAPKKARNFHVQQLHVGGLGRSVGTTSSGNEYTCKCRIKMKSSEAKVAANLPGVSRLADVLG